MTEMDLRLKLFETYTEYADQAIKESRWEAASAFQLAAQLAFGTTSKVDGDARAAVGSGSCQKPPQPSPSDFYCADCKPRT